MSFQNGLPQFSNQYIPGVTMSLNDDVRRSMREGSGVPALEQEIADLRRQLKEAQQARERAETELNETWTDEDGTVWTRPTPWAYAQACKRLWRSVEILRATLSAVPEKEVVPTEPGSASQTEGISVIRPGVARSGSGQESIWRVVSKVYVYRGDTPICHCHTPEDTAAIVEAMNETIKARVLDKFADHLDKAHVCHQTLSREQAEKMARNLNDQASFAATEDEVIRLIADALQCVAGEDTRLQLYEDALYAIANLPLDRRKLIFMHPATIEEARKVAGDAIRAAIAAKDLLT